MKRRGKTDPQDLFVLFCSSNRRNKRDTRTPPCCAPALSLSLSLLLPCGEQGGSGQTDMEALERQADKIRAAKAQGAAGAAGTAEANPEEIDLDMDMDAGVSELSLHRRST